MAEMRSPEMDRSDPGYQRRCILPDCPASFSILDVMDGTPDAPQGWHLTPRMFTGHLCPAHAPVAKEHIPAWVRVEGHVTGCSCQCEGWMWLPGVPVPLGEYQDRWAAHLADMAAANGAGI